MNDQQYFLTTSLSYQLKAAHRELADFRSAEAHQIRKPTLYICKWSVWYRLQKVTLKS